MALILKILWPKLKDRKIQNRSAAREDIRREILTSLRSGQRLFVVPGLDLVVVITAGAYDKHAINAENIRLLNSIAATAIE